MLVAVVVAVVVAAVIVVLALTDAAQFVLNGTMVHIKWSVLAYTCIKITNTAHTYPIRCESSRHGRK